MKMKSQNSRTMFDGMYSETNIERKWKTKWFLKPNSKKEENISKWIQMNKDWIYQKCKEALK